MVAAMETDNTSTEERRRFDALDRVLTRLALTKSNSLEKVLSKLLPAVLSELNVGSNLVLQKVIEILSHVNKLLSAQVEVKLPVEALLKVCHGEHASQVTRSYALMYIEKGFLRESRSDQEGLLFQLLDSVKIFQAQEAKYVVFRLALVSLDSRAAGKQQSASLDESQALGILNSARDKKHFVDFATHFILYQGPYNKGSSGGDADGDGDAQQRPVSPGLSADLMSRLKCQDESYENTVRRKVTLLSFLAKVEVEVELLLPLLVVAACDPNDSVSSLGEQLLRKKCAIANVHPLVNLEDRELNQKLYHLFHGSLEEGPSTSSKVQPANLVVRLKILSCFIHSIEAANSFPLTVKTIFECLYSPASNARLKLAGMEYCVWTLQHACQEQLAALGPIVLGGLVKFLHQHQFSKYDRSSIRMRQFSYEAISELGKRLPGAFSKDVGIVSELLRMITTEDEQVKVSGMEAMRLLSSAYSSTGREVKAKLEQMLTLMVSSPDESLRLLSIQWANSVFKVHEYHGLYLCIVATADESSQVVDEANKLLNWRLYREEARKGLIKTDDLVQYLLARNPEIKSMAGLKQMNKRMLQNMIKSIRHTRAGELESKVQINVSYAPMLSCALQSKDTELLVESTSAMLIEANIDPDAFARQFMNCKDNLRSLLGHTNERVRKGATILCGCVFSRLEKDKLREVLGKIMDEVKSLDVKKHLEKMHAGLLATAHTLGHLCLMESEMDEALLAQFHETVEELSDDSKINAHPLNFVVAESVGIVALCMSSAQNTSDNSLVPANFKESKLNSFVPKLKKFVESQKVDTVSSAVIALGRICTCSQEASQDLCSFLSTLIPTIKDGSHFALGEAFSYIFGEMQVQEKLLFADTMMDKSLKGFIYKKEAGESGSDQKADSAYTEDHVTMCNDVLEAILSKYAVHSAPKVRRNASIVLLAMIKDASDHPSVKSKVLELQSVFCDLIKDTEEITQEMASQGISLVYKMSKGEMRKHLVKNLVEGLTAVGLKARKVKLSEDTEMFDGNILGKDPSGKKISTYKHLCSIATDIGQPDMVYKFINLFNHNSLLQSKQGAAMGLTSLSAIAEEELAPMLPQIVPKLYRLLHDPSPGVEESMKMFWYSLVKDPTETLNKFFPLIVEELLEQLGSHLWRNRQSSAAALADLIRGRKWIELKNYFEGIWEGVFRVVDDIKETVRIAGMTLASSLQKTTARLCEGMIKEEKSPAAIVFPILLEKGIPSAVEEVKSLSLSVLYHLVKYSDKRLLGQYLPKIAGSLLECLSSLESSSMNYIEQHAERVGIDKERLENLRVKAANASIVGDMLDRITACVNSENLSDLCIKLSDLLKNGFGINTRAGAARFLSAITLRMRYDMKPVCSRMLKALISPLGNDSNLAICKAYASTFAQMSKFSEQKYVDARVDKLLEAIQDEDSTMQRAGAIFVLELCRQAPDVFSTYKQNILPIAFYMKHNTEEKVAKLWDSVWDEGAPSDSAAVRMYHIDIGNLCLSALKSDKYNTRRSGSVGIKDLVEKSNGFLLTNALELCAALVSMLPGRYWEGKESVLETLGLLCSKNSTNIPGIDEVLTSLSEPLKRKKTVMIVAAVNSIALVIEGVSSVKDSTLVEIIKLLVQNCSVEEEEEKEEGQTPNLEKTISSLNCLSKCWIAVQDKAIVGEEVFNLLIKMSDSSKESSWRVRNAAISAAKDILDSETALQALESHNKWLNPLGDSVLNTFCIEKREKSMSLLISLIGVLVERKYSKFMLEDLLGKIKASVSSKLDEISPALLAQAKRIVEEI